MGRNLLQWQMELLDRVSGPAKRASRNQASRACCCSGDSLRTTAGSLGKPADAGAIRMGGASAATVSSLGRE